MKKGMVVTAVLMGLSSVLCADGAAAYRACIGCHGPKGEKAALGKSKIINQMSKAEISAALKGYKEGSYGGPSKALMAGQAAKLDDAAITAIAELIGK